MKLTKFLISLPPCIFSVVCIIAVLYLTLVPRPLPDMDIPLFPGADKVVHAIMMMGVMLCHSTICAKSGTLRRRLRSLYCCCFL